MPASTKSRSYQAMIAHAAVSSNANNAWYLHTDARGIAATSTSAVAPTREDLIQGWMRIPTTTFHGRDADGYPIRRDHWHTRAEAETKIAHLFPNIPETLPAA